MQSNRTLGRLALGVVSALTIGLLGTFIGSSSFAAQPPAPAPAFTFNPFAVEGDREATVSVTNLTNTARQVRIRFFNANGEVVQQNRSSVAPGTSNSLTVDGSLGNDMVRALVSIPGGTKGWAAALSIINSGNPAELTELVASPSRGWRAKEGESFRVSTPLIRVGSEQEVRVNVTNLGVTDEEDFPVYQYDSAGQLLTQTVISDVAPQASAFTILSGSGDADLYFRVAVEIPSGARALIQPELRGGTGGRSPLQVMPWPVYGN